MPDLHFSLLHWIMLIGCGLLIGMEKSGLAGVSLVVVPILAYALGGKVSSGFLLPMLIIADVFAARYYHRHADWKHIGRLMPWAVIGVILGGMVGHMIKDSVFDQMMAALIFGALILLIWRDFRKSPTSVPDNVWFAPILGICGGFASMIMNAAGSILTIYLLAMHFNKLEFIGTKAWFFFIINVIKLPMHLLIWKTVSLQSSTINVMLAPAIIGGFLLGVKIVKHIPEKIFRTLIIAATIASAALLFM